MPRHWMQALTNYILEISYTYIKDIECRHRLQSLQFMQLQEYSCTRDSRDGFGEEDPGAVCELVECRETQLIRVTMKIVSIWCRLRIRKAAVCR